MEKEVQVKREEEKQARLEEREAQADMGRKRLADNGKEASPMGRGTGEAYVAGD